MWHKVAAMVLGITGLPSCQSLIPQSLSQLFPSLFPTREISPISSPAPGKGAPAESRLPVCVGIIDHQQDPGPLNNRRGGTWRFYRPQGGLWGLLHSTGEGAKKAGSWRGEGGCQGLGVPPLHGWGCRGAGGAVWALEVCHVAVRQVGHKAAVREASPEEIHGCEWWDGLFLLRLSRWGPEHRPGRGSGRVSSTRARGVLCKSAAAVFFYLWKQANKHISGNDLSPLRADDAPSCPAAGGSAKWDIFLARHLATSN